MSTTQTLEIIGYRDAPVPHTFWRQDAAAHHVAIVLPGLAYGCDLPLLYYPARLLGERGADVLRIAYSYHTDAAFRALTPAEQAQRLHAATLAACRVVLDQRAYERVTLIGKSLGTVAMGQLLTTEARLAGATAVWLTPLLRDDRLRAQVTQWGGRSLFVSGSADPHHDPAARRGRAGYGRREHRGGGRRPQPGDRGERATIARRPSGGDAGRAAFPGPRAEAPRRPRRLQTGLGSCADGGCRGCNRRRHCDWWRRPMHVDDVWRDIGQTRLSSPALTCLAPSRP